MTRGKFVLRATTTSPFGRKVRMAVEVLGLNRRVVREDADTLDENDTLRQQNPLGKMPVLLLADGTPIYDSRVIIEFLQEAAGSKKLLPLHGLERYEALTRASFADGIADAALLMVYEVRFRPLEMMKSERWLAHQRGKIMRTLAAFEAAPPPPGKTDIVSITLSCALGYLDWRKPVEWRAAHPRLVQWLAGFSVHEPAFARTAVEEQG
jgi:glutathione S-transferase